MKGSFLQRIWRWLKGEDAAEPSVSPDSRDDFNWLWPPTDIHSAAAWDQHWQAQISHGLGPGIFDLFCDEQALISVMRRRGMLTVLCAGNGISQEPRALAEAGLKVTALDLSQLAVAIAQDFQLSPEQLGRFFSPELRAPGGSVEFVVGDLLDPSVCPGPFDVVIERCTLQLFPPDERSSAVDALADRLSPDGIFKSHCHNGGWKPNEPRAHPFEALFVEKGWLIEDGFEGPHSDGRAAWLSLSTG